MTLFHYGVLITVAPRNCKRRCLVDTQRNIDQKDLLKVIGELKKERRVGDKITVQAIVERLNLILTEEGRKNISRKISKFVSDTL